MNYTTMRWNIQMIQSVSSLHWTIKLGIQQEITKSGECNLNAAKEYSINRLADMEGENPRDTYYLPKNYR